MILLLLACIKQAAPVQAPQGTEVRFVHWMQTENDGVVPIPEPVLETIQQALWKRNVRGNIDPDGAKLASLPAGSRLTGPEPAVLVGCSPMFDTQVNGRFRWRIECDVAVKSGENRFDRNVNAVAHLVYYKQRETEALEEAAPAVRREVGRALDAWLSL